MSCPRTFLLFLVLMILSVWREAPCQDRVAPTQPRPVQNWKVPPRPEDRQGSVIPDNPEAREIQPLAPPPRIEGPVFGNRPIEPLPEPPVDAVEKPPANTADIVEVPANAPLRDLFKDSLHPIVLSPERYLSVNGQGVALREGPGIDFRKVATLYQGDLVEWKDTDDDWHRVVISSGTDGWLASNLTEIVPQRIAIVTGERVNLRDAPTEQARILGSLFQGAVVIASETFGEWTQIRTPNLRNVYIASEYLEQLQEGQVPPFPFRKHPGVTSKVASLAELGSSATGEVEYLLAVQPGDWVKGGKVGLLYFSDYALPFLGAEPAPEPHFVSGTFFDKLLFKNQFKDGLPGFEAPEVTSESILVAYLRGQKENQVWTFPFKFARENSQGWFAICCQEGEFAGSYLPIEATALGGE
ncbi:MAG: SH3 domain-containing protein [Candidatus Omnitrophica bacterium]|nr:SH3 domain-containing protein [Candidatus Omnitrophota bacterium]